MSLHEEKACKSAALPLTNGDRSVLLFTPHDIQARNKLRRYKLGPFPASTDVLLTAKQRNMS